ncbi:MAG: long-chain fatty acid--CoA ligase [Pseudomonadaceae bacterium]|nr:long-chain fatty acid--CoA ligase [Pseudomonadaceae bacterium]
MAASPAPWQAHYPPDVGADLPADIAVLPALWAEAVAAKPAAHFLHFMGSRFSYAEVDAQMRTLMATLTAHGVTRGSRVGLCLPNCPLAVAAYYATLRLGAVVVNMNPLYTQDELAHLLHDSTPAVVVTVNLSVMLPKLAALQQMGLVPTLLVGDFTCHLPLHLRWGMRLFRRSQLAAIPVADGIVPLPVTTVTPVAETTVNPTDLAVLQYTGGTTGIPKAAMLSHGALAANVRQIQLWLGPPPPQGDTFLAILPLFHCFAMTAAMNLAIANKAAIVLLPQFNIHHVLKALARGVTLLPAVPTLINALVTSPHSRPHHFAHLRYAILGGAPLAPELERRFTALSSSKLVEGYGLSEASPVVTCNPRHRANRHGSAGLPLPSTRVRIVGKNGKEAKPGAVGEVQVQGPQLMDGYWNNPAATKTVFKHGWLATGDLGFMDAEGYLHLTDRSKDIILVNGYNVYPRIIEDALTTHPAVAEVMVIGIPDAKKGEVPHAFVVLKHGATATAEQLLAYARAKLNPLERPTRVVLRQSLPKTLVGKLSKKDLRAEVLGQ